MRRRFAVVIAISALMIGSSVLLNGQSGLKPLPVVTRTTPASDASVFRKPDVVFMGRIQQSCDIEPVSDVVRRIGERGLIVRQYLALESFPILVNEREATDPDLTDNQFYFRPRTDGVDLKVGRTYILLLNISRGPFTSGYYDIAHRHMGLEVTDGPNGLRVTPIIRGGDFDQFDGKLLDDVIKEIQTRK